MFRAHICRDKSHLSTHRIIATTSTKTIIIIIIIIIMSSLRHIDSNRIIRNDNSPSQIAISVDELRDLLESHHRIQAARQQKRQEKQRKKSSSSSSWSSSFVKNFRKSISSNVALKTLGDSADKILGDSANRFENGFFMFGGSSATGRDRHETALRQIIDMGTFVRDVYQQHNEKRKMESIAERLIAELPANVRHEIDSAELMRALPGLIGLDANDIKRLFPLSDPFKKQSADDHQDKKSLFEQIFESRIESSASAFSRFFAHFFSSPKMVIIFILLIVMVTLAISGVALIALRRRRRRIRFLRSSTRSRSRSKSKSKSRSRSRSRSRSGRQRLSKLLRRHTKR